MTIVEIQKGETTSQTPTITKQETMDIDTSRISSNVIDASQQQQQQDVIEQVSCSGSGLHASSIISPIQIANLPASILEQLQQHYHHGTVNIITSLPPSRPSSISPNNMIVNFHPPPATAQEQQPQQSLPPAAPHIITPSPTSKKVSANHHDTTNTTTTTTTTATTKETTTVTTKGLTADERRQRRLLRNRLAAKDCRRKKKEYIQMMQETISRLEGERESLKGQIVNLKEQLNQLPPQDDDNYKLIKEVTELNAKLGSMK